MMDSFLGKHSMQHSMEFGTLSVNKTHIPLTKFIRPESTVELSFEL